MKTDVTEQAFISKFTNENDIILDSFCYGTTGVVSKKKLNRLFIGIEKKIIL